MEKKTSIGKIIGVIGIFVILIIILILVVIYKVKYEDMLGLYF